jgi:uncharacterized membrane protein YhhN
MTAPLVVVLAVAVLLFAEARGMAPLRRVAKYVASCAFVLYALPALEGPPFARWMFAGLALGAVGDVALLGIGRRAFLTGLGAFLAGHVAYLIGIAQLLAPRQWLAGAGWLGIAFIVAGGAIAAALWRRLGSLRVPVAGYIAAITAMTIGALAVYRTGALPAPAHLYLAAGAALFWCSDIAVARDRFVGRSLANKLWGLPAYYAGQLAIATAIN